MGENDSGKLHSKSESRPVLGDVTNQLARRGFPLVSRSPSSKSLSGNKRSAEDSDGDSEFWRQVSLVVEKLEKERCGVAKCPKIGGGSEVGLSPLKGGKTYRLSNSSGDVGYGDGNVGLGSQSGFVEVKESSFSALDSIDLGENQHWPAVASEDVAAKEGSVSSGSSEKNCVDVGNECQGDEVRGLSQVGDSDCCPVPLAVEVVSDSGKCAGVGCFGSSRYESAATSKMTEPQERRSFGLERCTLLTGDGGSAGIAAETDLIKHCSCAFCTKAAYIWSDLQYQDAKGRISALTKSQKDASNLALKYNAGNGIGRSQGTSSNTVSLETDLVGVWKSLFLNMENVFVAESSQLQTNFLALKDLREEYKVNLEMMNGMPSDIQQGSSDGSDNMF